MDIIQFKDTEPNRDKSNLLLHQLKQVTVGDAHPPRILRVGERQIILIQIDMTWLEPQSAEVTQPRTCTKMDRNEQFTIDGAGSGGV